MKGKKQIVSGVILLTLGLMLGVGWFFAQKPVLLSITDHEIREQLVVESTGSTGYYNWEEGNALNNPNYYVYYMWNITNSEEVLANGAAPNFQQVGPYYYRYYWYNKNATFTDGGNLVTFNLIEDYIYLPEMTTGNAYTDVIVNINPAWIAIMEQTTGDSSLIVAVAVPFTGYFLEFCTSEFLNVLTSQNTPALLSTVTEDIFTYLTAQNVSDPEAFFYNAWANATTVPSVLSNWTNMLLSATNNGSSDIPMETVVQLFNASASLSLLDQSPQAIMTWFLAYQSQESQEAETLMTTFHLTTPQLQAILVWRNVSFIDNYVKPSIMEAATLAYPGASWTDVGWIQFVSGNFTGQQPFASIYSTWYPELANPFELFNEVDLSVNQAKSLLVGPYGILENIENFGLFSAKVQNFSTDYSEWNITATQAGNFFGYLSTIGGEYSLPFINGTITAGQSGLLITQTVDYWLWRCNDPIVAFLMGSASAGCSLQNNNTVQPPSQTYTGKNDINQLNKYTMWRNQSVVNYWAAPVVVNGSTDTGQFPPRVQENQQLYVWDESFTKTVTFSQQGTDEVSGINTRVYKLDNDAFAVSTLYTNTILGFANETAANQGVPIFLSNWDFYGVSSNFVNMTNMNPSAGDITTLFVEPTTGSTIQANMKLQVNLLYNASFTYEVFDDFANVNSTLMYPLVKIWQQSTISSSMASTLRKSLEYTGTKFDEILLWCLVGFGALLAVIGLALIVRGAKHRKRGGYAAIQ